MSYYSWTDGESLRKLRIRERIEQAELANEAGLSQSLISLIESGKIPVTNEARTHIDNGIGTIINARFHAMPAVQVLLKENESLKNKVVKLTGKVLDESRDAFINGLLVTIEQQNKELAELREQLSKARASSADPGEVEQHAKRGSK